MICGLHHNPITFSTGGGVRTFNVLSMLGDIFNAKVTLYSFSDSEVADARQGFCQKKIEKPLILQRFRSGYLCLVPSLISGVLNKRLSDIKPSVVVFESIFMAYAVLKSGVFTSHNLKIYDAHNVESLYWKPYYEKLPFGSLLLKAIKRIEKYVAANSDYVFATSQEESRIFQNEYGLSSEKIRVVPNGVDTSNIRPYTEKERADRKRALGFSYRRNVVFIGSAVKANTDACSWIINTLSPRMPDVCFLVIGNVSRDFNRWPQNVKPLGILDIDEKNAILSSSDAAINPVEIGAGTNVKMLEYMAAGLPIVTTKIGARGLGIDDNRAAIVCERDEFKDALERIFRDVKFGESLSYEARNTAERFDWQSIRRHLQIELGVISP